MSDRTSTPSARGPFQGVFQIVAFNWTRYMGGCVVVVFAGLLAWRVSMPAWMKVAILAGGGGAFAWMLVSVVVSHWIYDRSMLYRWDWIADWFPSPLGPVANIHAGLDESSDKLRQLFPGWFAIWDIHDPELMTEPSIGRARQRRSHTSARAVDWRKLPSDDGAFEAVFLIFAAHEIRSAAAREHFFKELQRILKPSGELLIVEHLRDWKNFVAYGPGVLHFLPRGEWLRLADVSGFQMKAEFSITPFVRVFQLRNPI